MLTTVSKELLTDAVRLHGHLGPFLVLGLKMSLRAKEILSQKPDGCRIETMNRKPFICVVDGVRTVMESDKIIVKDGDGLLAGFSLADGKEVIIRVKKALVKKYAEGPWERSEEYAYEVMKSEDEELFESITQPTRSLLKRRPRTRGEARHNTFQ